jgi:hypothetical protein
MAEWLQIIFTSYLTTASKESENPHSTFGPKQEAPDETEPTNRLIPRVSGELAEF